MKILRLWKRQSPLERLSVVACLMLAACIFLASGDPATNLKNTYYVSCSDISEPNSTDDWVPRVAGWIVHEHIAINNDSELLAFTPKSGDGSYEIPYIIENLLIEPGNSHGINISNTRAYLIIRNCTIQGATATTGGTGIYLNNVTNVRLEGNVALDNEKYGIFVEKSSNVTVIDNILYENDGVTYTAGLRFSMVNDSIIRDNLARNNKINGFAFDLSTNLTIYNNTLFQNDYLTSSAGIEFYYLFNCTFTFNNITGNQLGFSSPSGSTSQNLTISNNQIHDSSVNGFSLYNVKDLQFVHNNLTNNGPGGAYCGIFSNLTYSVFHNNSLLGHIGIQLAANSDFNNITSNYFTGLAGTTTTNYNGIYINTGKNNTIFNNTLEKYRYGIQLNTNVFNTSILQNNVSLMSYYGIYLTNNANYNDILYNNISSCTNMGIYLYSNLHDNNLIGNRVWATTWGIQFSTNVHNNTISWNTLTGNSQYGLYIRSTAHDNNVTYNNISANEVEGFHLSNTAYNTRIEYNNFTQNQGNGVTLTSTCNNTLIQWNNFSKNSGQGIAMTTSITYTNFSHNVVNENLGWAVYISSGNFNIIEQNTIHKNGRNGLYLGSSSNNQILWNNVTENGIGGVRYDGIYIYSSSLLNTIAYNQVQMSGSSGIRLYFNSAYNNVSYNNVSTSYNHGISVESASHYNSIVSNLLTYNEFNGIYISGSNYCDVHENVLTNNEINGISISNSGYSNFTSNHVVYNGYGGIYLSGASSINSTICNNYVAHTYWDDEDTEIFGIQVEGTINTTVSNNFIYNNTDIGLYLYDLFDGLVINNNVTDQVGRVGIGVWIEGYNSLVFTQNNISSNGKYGIWFYNANNFDVCLNFIANNGWGEVFCDDMGQLLGNQYLFGLYWNYWGDYESRYPLATQTNGIWNTPYQVNSTGMYDYYPLVTYSAVMPNVPARPELLTQSQTVFDTNITLAWQPIVGATSYFIYVNATYNQTVATTQCVMQLYFIGTFHYFITAFNATGQSLQSNIVSIERLQGVKDVFLWSKNWSSFLYYGEGGLGDPALTTYNGYIYGVSQIIDNVTGFTDHYAVIYAKWDPEGNLMWNRTLELPQFVEVIPINIWAGSTGVFICGIARNGYTFNQMAFLTKINCETGNVLWTNNVTTGEWATAVHLTGIGSYIYTVGEAEPGEEESKAPPETQLFLVKWDANSGSVMNAYLWDVNVAPRDEVCDIWSDGVSLFIAGSIWAYDDEYMGDIPQGFVAEINPQDFSVVWITILDDTPYEHAFAMTGEGTLIYVYLYSEDGERIVMLSTEGGAIIKSEIYLELDPIWIYGMEVVNGNLFIYGQYYLYDGRDNLYYAALVLFTRDAEYRDTVLFTEDVYFTGFCYTNGAAFLFTVEDYTYLPFPSWNQRFICLTRYQVEMLPYTPVAPNLLSASQTIAVLWILLEWTSSNGATGYEIFVNGAKVGTTSGNTFNLTFIGNGTYTIYLRAYNAVGSSVNSNSITVVVAVPPLVLSEEPPNLLPLIVGGAMAGSVIGIAGANTMTPEKLEQFRKRRYKRYFESKADKMATASDMKPQGGSTSPSSPTIAAEAVPAASYKDIIDKLRVIWDQIPSELRDGVVKAIDKYYKFKDEAVILVYNSFKGLSNGLFNACELLRQGKLQDALLKLDEVSKNAMEKKFTDLAEEATVLSKEHVKGGKS